ncbi:hypothetical protein A2617_00585 [Candidatus Daviesbacteria bacterium RIFOXYD1_FULL_41_10]|uniref:RNA-binding protein KhpA n=2 Tax=Candidatus Daviesiibacteriota TaxID=1752718 RepID=A0A1F5N2K3_9BACT|nr:MAG: hypothetical protein UU67_C0023G0007 [Candidatus Daviesbacteria bacterium GW2011_GWB1_41_5]OGE71874.1 MAG: hypothetical protein A2617_00585 [Candidatus Daviesbacteria bacterium RIFOXYD1_FULL_41_10]
MKDLLEYLVKNLVSKPDEVRVEEQQGEGMVNFILTVAPDDMGIIIGKMGQTIKAIRKVLVARAMAENQNIRVNVSLNENPGHNTVS